MAVYLAAAYKESPIDPISHLLRKSMETQVIDKFCASDVAEIKRVRAVSELRDKHQKEIKEKMDNYAHPDKYTKDDIEEYIKHNQKVIADKAKKSVARGALLDPLVLLTVAVIVGIIIWTVMCWIKDCKLITKLTLTFICWMFVYIAGMTIIQLRYHLRQQATELLGNDKELAKLEKAIIKGLKDKCGMDIVK